ncbi:MAG TPA: alkaline phosphatase family protein [Gammaproteobacteria bacterium]|nr:alkaline phosphatase family protein [Gammaproteobacteria bacterium]
MESLHSTIRTTLVVGGLLAGIAAGSPAAFARANTAPGGTHRTATPIRHVILVLGENRTFDSVFGTWKPPTGQHVKNLLSEGIVRADGSPGPEFARGAQWHARDTGTYSIHPEKTAPYDTLGPITTTGTPSQAPFATVAAARAAEPGLPEDAYTPLTEGGSGLPAGTAIDPRFPSDLPDGPFDLTRYVGYHDYTGSPTHRFFQMWQQVDCSVAVATIANPGGCRNDLWAWVEATVGNGSNGQPRPADYAEPGHHQGPVAMGFYNMHRGDAGYFDKLASEYALGDNFHQSVMGGTGANHAEIGFGTGVYYTNADGQPAKPPQNQIEDPNAQPGTNNFYKQDGYSGGSYVECADPSQPGVASIRNYLKSLPYPVFRNGDCRPGAYYLVNNYNPGYYGTGAPRPLGPDQFTVPPTTQQNIGLLLSRHGISWHYYGEGWNGGNEGTRERYCNICDPFLYSKQIMTNPKLRRNLKGIRALYSDIDDGSLPAVSIVKPDGYLDGHPASSKLGLFEAFCRKIIEQIKARPSLWAHTAIVITFDEGGGYYDSGYIQPIDFFGDGPRIPLIVVSPYSRHVGVVHTYGDHVSFDKFVEANWGLGTISDWSRDNLPNPVASPRDPYVPLNSPAIGDLMGMFHFGRDEHRAERDGSFHGRRQAGHGDSETNRS